MLFCSLTVDMSDDELKECVHKMHPMCVKHGQGFLLTIGGYDYDKRELWQIPEAVAFCQRLIDIGFISLLELSAATAKTPGSPGFGVMEVWFIASGRIKNKAKYPITQNDWQTAFKMVGEANVKTEAILAQPCPDAGIKQTEQYVGRTPNKVNEGSHRHSNQWHKGKKS